MTRLALLGTAILLAIWAAPIAIADPADSTFCAQVQREMAKWPETQNLGVSDCALVTNIGMGNCNYLKAGKTLDDIVDTSRLQWNWSKTTAAIVAVYAIYNYCPEYTRMLSTESKQVDAMKPLLPN